MSGPVNLSNADDALIGDDGGAPADRPPARGEALAMFVAAVLLRAAVMLAAWAVFHLPPVPPHGDKGLRAEGQTVITHAERGDGASYMAYARAIGGDRADMSEYDRRVFPGYPLVIAGVHLLGVPIAWAGLLVSWLAAGAAAPLAASLCRSRRVGWAMVFLIPHYVLYGSMIMNESLLLAFTLAGLWFALCRPHATAAAAIALGLAGTVRPMACFAVAGLLVHLAIERHLRRAALIGAGALAVVLLGMLASRHWMGDALKSLHVYRDDPRAYDGNLLTWPLKSIIYTPGIMHSPLWKTLYVWAHVAMIFAASAVLIVRCLAARRAGRPVPMLDRVCLVWLLGNTAFIICVGNIWGFIAFHRFTCWALLPVFWAFRPILPRRWWGWALVGGLSFAISLGSVPRS